MTELAAGKRQIILAAERLFATHGIDGVSLRQIGLAAGHANNSAVHYHFGSKDELVQAIFDYRLADLHARREATVTQIGIEDVRSWLECHLRALFEQADIAGSYYLRFLNHLDLQPIAAPSDHIRRMDIGERVFAFHARLDALMESIAEPLRGHRIAWAQKLMLQAGASRERARQDNAAVLPFEAEVADMVDALSAFLATPVSPRTIALCADGLSEYPPVRT